MAVIMADFVILLIIIYFLNITIGRGENKFFVKFFGGRGSVGPMVSHKRPPDIGFGLEYNVVAARPKDFCLRY
jgi:hypothetical protein